MSTPPPGRGKEQKTFGWFEILSSAEERVNFLLEPYIPVEGIVFLHGKPSLGKSPLVWWMGLSIASGRPFLGLQTRQGTVVYIEVDGPPVLVRPRLRLLQDAFPDDVPFHTSFLHPGFDVLRPTAAVQEELALLRGLEPSLVIVNTLRKTFPLSANESEVPSLVYGAFQRYFPGSAILLVGHDRKATADDQTLPGEESHSGSQAWRNDAQVVLHLVKQGGRPSVIRLDHTKSQVSELYPPMMLKLGEDGSHLSLLGEATLQETLDALSMMEPGLSRQEQDLRLAEMWGCSERTARRRRVLVGEMATKEILSQRPVGFRKSTT